MIGLFRLAMTISLRISPASFELQAFDRIRRFLARAFPRRVDACFACYRMDCAARVLQQ